jgi:hypothetical protein
MLDSDDLNTSSAGGSRKLVMHETAATHRDLRAADAGADASQPASQSANQRMQIIPSANRRGAPHVTSGVGGNEHTREGAIDAGGC